MGSGCKRWKKEQVQIRHFLESVIVELYQITSLIDDLSVSK